MVRITRETNNYSIRKTVRIHVVSKVGKAITVADSRNELAWHTDLMQLPRSAVCMLIGSQFGSFIPDIAGNHVHSAVAIQVSGSHTF